MTLARRRGLSSLHGLADTDSESVIFSSGLLILFVSFFLLLLIFFFFYLYVSVCVCICLGSPCASCQCSRRLHSLVFLFFFRFSLVPSYPFLRILTYDYDGCQRRKHRMRITSFVSSRELQSGRAQF